MRSEGPGEALLGPEVTGRQWRLFLLVGMAWGFGAFPLLTLSYALAGLLEAWDWTTLHTGATAGLSLVGMLLGAPLGGLVADRYGRRPALVGTVAGALALSALSALAWDFSSLVVLRFLSALGLGGALTIPTALIGEIAPPSHRGRMVVVLEAVWVVGAVASAGVGSLALPLLGWRAVLALGGLPLLAVPFWARGLVESPSFLVARGRVWEARAVLERLGANPLPDLGREDGPPSGVRSVGALGLLWSPPYARRTALLWALWFSMMGVYYGLFLWLPSLMVGAGFPGGQTLLFTLYLMVAQMPGVFLSAWVVDRGSRRGALFLFLGVLAVSAFFFGATRSPLLLLLWGGVFATATMAVWLPIQVLTAESYPTLVRGQGTGYVNAVGRVGAILGSTLTGWATSLAGGYSPVFAGVALFLLLLMGLVALLLREGPEAR